MRVVIVLLAAGRSARMGFPKQLWKWEGRTLIRRMAETALAVRSSGISAETVVITGAGAEETGAEVRDLAVRIQYNPDWEEGMASSLRTATEAAGDADALLVLLTDQPAVSTGLLETLLDTWKQQPDQPVVSDYGDAWGPPLVLPLSFRSDLLALRGDTGAKAFLKKHPERLIRIPFPQGKLDLDTPEDLLRLGKRGFGL